MTWVHVDDLKSSHINQTVNNNFETFLNKCYGNCSKVTTDIGKFHECLRMKLDYHEKGRVKTNMTDYINEMIDN